MHGGIQVNVDTHALQRARGNLAVALGVYELSLFQHIGGEGNIFRDGEVGNQRKVLKNHLNPVGHGFPGAEGAKLLAIEEDGSRVCGFYTTHNFDEGRFSRTVFTGKTVNVAWFDGEADIRERKCSTKSL